MQSKENEDLSKRAVFPGLTVGESKCDQIEHGYVEEYSDAPAWRNPIIITPKDPEAIHVFLIKKIDDEKSAEFCVSLLEVLHEYKTKVFVEENTYKEVSAKASEEIKEFMLHYEEKEEANIDFVIIAGGDGTILYTLKFFQKRVVPPIIAYSKGSLNYLCPFSMEDYDKNLRRVIEAIQKGKPLEVEKRYRLYCELRQGDKKEPIVYHALNEVVIGTGTLRMISVDCALEGKHFATFEGDGVMVSTPTGSTAYQLSTGGPIVNHLMFCMSISMIAGISLSNRPVILPPALKLLFKSKTGKHRGTTLNLDGQVVYELEPNYEVLVTGSALYVPFLIGDKKDTLDNWIWRLRNMLGWNRNFTDEQCQEIYKD